MSVVRSLLVRVGFQTDRSSVNQANKVVDRFKLRLALIASAATYAATKVVGFFNSIGTRLLNADDLARTLGLSLKEIIAIQKAASNFRIDENQINAAFTKLNELLVGFRTKTNLELAEIARALRFEITEEDTALSIFDKINTGLANVASIQERIRIAGNIYGSEIAPQIAELAGNVEKFNDANKNFLDNSSDIQKSVEAFKAYDQAIRGFNEAWQTFAIEIAPDVVNALTNIVDGIKNNFEWVKFFYNFQSGLFQFARNPFTNQQPLKDALMQGSRLLDPIFNDVKSSVGSAASSAKGIILDAASGLNKYAENSDEFRNLNGRFASQGTPNFTFNNDINVAPGTSLEQTQSMTEAITDSFRSAIENSWREIQYNNPQVE